MSVSSMLTRLHIVDLLGADIFYGDAVNALVIPDPDEVFTIDGNSYTVQSREFKLDTSLSPAVLTVKIQTSPRA